MTQDMKQVNATQTMFAETMQYFHHLPPKRERDARRLGKWADEAIEVFGWDEKKGEGNG